MKKGDFIWESRDTVAMREELSQIGYQGMINKYGMSRSSLYRVLGTVGYSNPLSRRSIFKAKRDEISLENSKKISTMYRESIEQIQPPEYTGPFKDLFNKQLT